MTKRWYVILSFKAKSITTHNNIVYISCSFNSNAAVVYNVNAWVYFVEMLRFINLLQLLHLAEIAALGWCKGLAAENDFDSSLWLEMLTAMGSNSLLWRNNSLQQARKNIAFSLE